MKDTIVNISAVSKRFGQQLVLDNVSVAIKRGQICGLVGENGAGKTSLLRILCGLSFASQGEIEVDPHLKIGSLIESPALYLNLSAYDNLKYMGLQLGLDNLDQRIQEVLKLIGLADVSKKKRSKNFSLGMRQRLAIGMSLLDQPDLLILDEPINGLDPSGIKEMRELLLSLRDDKQMTILISSHLLSELEQIADYFVLMNKGKVLEILDTTKLGNHGQRVLYLATNDNEKMRTCLEEKGISVQLEHDYLLLTISEKPMSVIKMVEEAQLEVYEIFYRKLHFEDYYLNQIGGEATC